MLQTDSVASVVRIARLGFTGAACGDADASGTGDVPCHLRGGSYFDDEINNLPCGNDFYQYKLTSFWGDLGFRCCSL